VRRYPHTDGSVFGIQHKGERTGPEAFGQEAGERRHFSSQCEGFFRGTAEQSDELAGVAAFDLEQPRNYGLSRD
jgi:hypothetical protein